MQTAEAGLHVAPITQQMLAREQGRRIGIGLCVLALIVAGLISVNLGNYPIHLFSLLSMWLDSADSNALRMPLYVLLELRIPRLFMAALVGALLAVAGCAMQGLVRNPLADPGLIGIAGGAAAAAALSLAVFTPTIIPASWWVASWAFGGALVSVWLVLKVASSPVGITVATLILAGVAINAIAGTVIGAVSYVASDDALRQISYWTMGSLGGANWQAVGMLTVVAGIAIWGLCRFSRALNLMALGENEAACLGVNVKRVKSRLLWLVAFAVAMATALCGVIGFVGLVVPHIARRLFGVDHRYLMPVSALLGALLLVLADCVSRALMPPLEIPIGIVTSALGSPFFLYLLWQSKKDMVA